MTPHDQLVSFDQRSETLATARARHPERFTTTTDPKNLALPEAAWINQSQQPAETEATQTPVGTVQLENTGDNDVRASLSAGARPCLRAA